MVFTLYHQQLHTGFLESVRRAQMVAILSSTMGDVKYTITFAHLHLLKVLRTVFFCIFVLAVNCHPRKGGATRKFYDAVAHGCIPAAWPEFEIKPQNLESNKINTFDFSVPFPFLIISNYIILWVLTCHRWWVEHLQSKPNQTRSNITYFFYHFLRLFIPSLSFYPFDPQISQTTWAPGGDHGPVALLLFALLGPRAPWRLCHLRAGGSAVDRAVYVVFWLKQQVFDHVLMVYVWNKNMT